MNSIRENVTEFAIGDRMDSDHMSLLLSMEGEEEKQNKRREKKARSKGDNYME